jgi:glyoxylase-like metal-dependent hydrolase (beta-lactamase superfamily II)
VADNPGPMTLDGTRNYLVGTRRAILLDPGPADDEQAARVDELVGGIPVALVCLTHAHADHAAGAAETARRLGATLAASAATLRALGEAGRVLEDGEKLPVDGGRSLLRVLATPGHSSDHLAFLQVPSGDLFTGDLVLGRGTAMVGDPDGHMGSYLASLERLAELHPRRILPGHGDPVTDPASRLREYHRHRLVREEQIEAAVLDGAISVADIRSRVYGELPAGLEWAAEASIRAHLKHLEEGGERLPDLQGRDVSGGSGLHEGVGLEA